jgi:hypothetical protein
VIYPTQAEVGRSLEGWVAGTSIPCDVKNAEILRERLDELRRLDCDARMCRWDGGDGALGGASGRVPAVPHMKSFVRYCPDDRTLPWAMLGSHNLSQAAWGKLEVTQFRPQGRGEPPSNPPLPRVPRPDSSSLTHRALVWQKQQSQLYIKSWELSVLLLPSLLPRPAPPAGAAGEAAPAPSLLAPQLDGPAPPASACVVPLPYSLPPVPYEPGDVCWSTADGQNLPRAQHNVPSDRHGRYPAEAHGGYYGRNAIGRVLCESVRELQK